MNEKILQSIDKGWEALNQKHYALALKQFNPLLADVKLATPNGRRLYLGLARCYEGLKNYDKAQQFFLQLQTRDPHDKSVLLSFARFYQNKGDFDKAIQLFAKLFKQHPKDISIVQGLARCYEAMGNYQQALKTYQPHQASSDKSILLGIAHCYEKLKQPDFAFPLYQTLYQKYAYDKQVGLSLARYYEMRQDYFAALEVYQTLQKRSPNDKQVLLSLACCHETFERLDIATTLLSELNVHYPHDTQVLFSLARCYARSGYFKEALSLYTSLQSMSTTNPKQISLSLARCYEEMDDFKHALGMYEILQTQYPKDDTIIVSYARCYQHMGRYEDSLRVYQQREQTAPKSDQLILGIAHCYEAMECYAEAIIRYQLLYQRHENDSAIGLSLARCYQNAGQYHQAMTYFLQLQQRYPHHKMIQLGLVRCYQDLHQYEAALEGYAQLQQQFPQDKQVFLALARYYEQLGDAEKSLELFKQLAAQYPLDVTVGLGLAQCYQLFGASSEALAYYEQLRRRFSQHKVIVLNYARCYEQFKRYKEAERLYRQLVREFPYYLEAHFSYAVFLEKYQQSAEAIAIYEALLKQFPAYKPASISLAICYQKANNTMKAKQRLETSFKQFPTYGPFYAAYLLVLLMNHETSEALTFYKHVENQLSDQPYILQEMKELLYLSESSETTSEDLLNLSQLTTNFETWQLDKPFSIHPTIDLPLPIKTVLQTLTKANYTAYVVGGAVRDLLLGLPVHDIDILTNATPADILKLFKGSQTNAFITRLCTLDEMGLHFDFLTNQEIILKSPHALRNDAKTRDFTINALYCDAKGRLHDPLKVGLHDLQYVRELQVIGDALPRFQEDPLRILRASRFCIQYNLSLQPAVKEAMISCTSLLKTLSLERLRSELAKHFLRGYAVKNVDHLFVLGLLQPLFPSVHVALEKQPALKTWLYQELAKTDYLVKCHAPVSLDYIYALFVAVAVAAQLNASQTISLEALMEHTFDELFKQNLTSYRLQHIKQLAQLCIVKINTFSLLHTDSLTALENENTFAMSTAYGAFWQPAHAENNTAARLSANSDTTVEQQQNETAAIINSIDGCSYH